MNIYIIVEIKKREFLSRFLLALEAASNGHSVYLGNIVQLLDKNLLKPGLIHHKSLTPNKKRINQLKNLRKRNFLITSQDEEVGHVNENGSEYVSTRFGESTIKLVDYLFTWGKFDYKNLSSKYPKLKKKIINTGNPRADYWRKDFKKYYGKKSNKYILISSNFENIFGNTTLYEKYKFLKETKYFKLGMSEKLLFKRMTIEAILIEKFINLLKKLAKIYKRKKFLFRPHPIENSSHWKIIFEDYKNFLVDNSNNLSDALNKAEIVMHNGCTGGLESAIREIPTISYMPIKDTIGHPISNRVSIIKKTESSVISEIKKILNKKKKYELKKNSFKEIDYRFENISNKPSYKNIVKFWNNLKDNKHCKVNNEFLIKAFLKSKLLRKNISPRPYVNVKFKPFSNSEILEIKSRLENINPKYKKVKIELLSEDLMKLYQTNKL